MSRSMSQWTKGLWQRKYKQEDIKRAAKKVEIFCKKEKLIKKAKEMGYLLCREHNKFTKIEDFNWLPRKNRRSFICSDCYKKKYLLKK
jgi:hypothetical protein